MTVADKIADAVAVFSTETGETPSAEKLNNVRPTPPLTTVGEGQKG